MKKGIHPQYEKVTYTCSCGATFENASTKCQDQRLEVCADCHPFYTGNQKTASKGKKSDKFKSRFGATISSKTGA